MMGPYARFRDIPQFTFWGGYAIDVSWSSLEKTLLDLSSGVTMDMDPDFQRAHVWNEAQQIAFVEYILRNGQSSRDILWNCPDWPVTENGAPMQLVDGKQRVEAVRRFMRDEIPAFGRRLSGYEDEPRYIHARFKFHINGLKTRAEVLQWYLDLNRGGTVHTDAEIDKVRALLEAERLAPDPEIP